MSVMSAPAQRSPIATIAQEPFRAPGWLATIHIATTFAVATPAFIGTVAGLAVGGGLLVVALVGLPIIWLVFGLGYVVSRIDAWRSRMYLGEEIPLRPGLPQGGNIVGRLWRYTWSREPWLRIVYTLLILPLIGWVGSLLVLGAWGAGIFFVLYPLYGWALPAGNTFLGWDLSFLGSAIVHLVLGVAMLLAAPWLARLVAALHVVSARALLSPSAEEQLKARVGTLEDTRSRMVEAADAERRRIERDLHDGAQQRLVSVAMTLGRAQTRFSDDPDAARKLLDEAHAETKHALTELRNLARGIHPAVLTDRGLDAALSALAERCPVPTTVSYAVPERPPRAIEAVAYFVVAEALTNVAKHAQADHAWVNARTDGAALIVEITDDGVGGASTEAGSGLTGLRDRVRAVDGTFMLTSPPGGVTTIHVELPCES